MASGKKTGGRKRGTPNRITKAFREMVLSVNDKLGGEAHMLEWAKENKTEFYRICARLIPTELTGNAAGGVTVHIVRGLADDTGAPSEPDTPTLDAVPTKTH